MMKDVTVQHEEPLIEYLGYKARTTLWSDGRWTLRVYENTPAGVHYVIADEDGDYDDRPDEDMVKDRIDDIIAGY